MKPPCVRTRVVVTSALLLACTLSATRVAQAGGLFPEGYPKYDALHSSLERLAKAQPDRVQLRPLAKSLQGRTVWLVTLGKPDEGKPKKPAILLVANAEADHVVGSQVALGLIERLATAGGDAASFLDRCTLYIVPRLNPDGAERVLAGPAVELRGNLRAVDRDRDGRLAEDGPDDLDGDGALTRMRVKDPITATLIPDDKDPRILRPADAAKGERPVYSEEAEGRDDDGDGLRNEDPPSGVNLNRNWPHRWTEFDPETGFSPASEPEVHALIQFAYDHPEIAVVWSFGLNDNLREEPKKPGSDLDDGDLPLFAELSRVFGKATAPKAAAAGGSPAGKGAPAPGATTDGSIAAWAYHQFGAVALASRLWTTPEIPPQLAASKDGKPAAKDAKPLAIPEDAELRWLFWNDHVVGGKAFVPFHPVKHPTLGDVEVGGWRPGVRINPPVDDVPAIAESHLAFLRELANRLPRLGVPDVKVESRGGGVFAVTARVRNEGAFPTALVQGVKNRKALPVLVRLETGGAKLLAGNLRAQVDRLPGAGGVQEFRWLLLVPETLTNPEARLTVTCPRAGAASVAVPLR